MICGSCKATDVDIEHVRNCGPGVKARSESSFAATKPPTDPDDGRCATPGCGRRTARDNAGEYLPMCSTCHAAGLKPIAPGHRNDVPDAAETKQLLEHYRDAAVSDDVHARIADLRHRIAPK